MKSYHLVGEDEKMFQIQHPDGQTFSVAKNLLSPVLQKKIKALSPMKMKDGGIVPDVNWDTTQTVEPFDTMPATPVNHEISNPYLDQMKDFAARNNINATPAEIEQQAQALNANNAIQMGINQQPVISSRSPEMPPPIQEMQTKSSGPIFNPMDLSQNQIAAQNKAIDIQQKANKEMAEAASKGMLGQANIWNDFQKHVSDIDAQYAPIEKRLNENNQNLFNSIQSNKIDPNRLWNEKSTGNKVMAAIGIALSGIGQGLQGPGSKNMALEMLDREIERDIDAQRAELGKKQTLYSENLKQLGDARAAKAATKAQLMTVAQAQGNALAARIGSAEALGKMQILNSGAELERAKLNNEAMLFHAVTATGKSDKNPEALISYLRMKKPEMAKELEGRYVPGVGIAAVPVSEKARGDLAARQSLQEQVNNLREWSKKHAGSVDPATMAYGHALSNSVQDAYRRANGQGVFREAEADFVKRIVAEDPTAFFNKLRVDPKYKALEDSNMMELNALRKSYGLPEAAAQPVLRQTKDGRIALFDPKTKQFLGYRQ